MTSVKIAPNCMICDDCEISGDVTIGSGTIIHPKARIVAEAGPIFIGENNLIEDRSLIHNKGGSEVTGATPVMIIGNFNVFEVGAHCEALKVGDNNVFEVKSYVGREVVVSDGCVIGAGCCLNDTETLAKQAVVCGKNCQRTVTMGHQSQAQQMETLAKILPNYLNVNKNYRANIN